VTESRDESAKSLGSERAVSWALMEASRPKRATIKKTKTEAKNAGGLGGDGRHQTGRGKKLLYHSRDIRRRIVPELLRQRACWGGGNLIEVEEHRIVHGYTLRLVGGNPVLGRRKHQTTRKPWKKKTRVCYMTGVLGGGKMEWGTKEKTYTGRGREIKEKKIVNCRNR